MIVVVVMALSMPGVVSAQRIFRDDFEPRPFGGWEFIAVPEVDDGAAFSGLRATNAGLYFHVERSDSTRWIYRHKLQAVGQVPWTTWPNDGSPSITEFVPLRPESEGTDEFAIFFYGWDRYGLIGVNTGTPAVLDHPVPLDTGGDSPDFMASSGGQYPRYWAVYPRGQNTTTVKVEGFDLVWRDVTVLDFFPSLVEADRRDAHLWLAGPDQVAKVDTLGGVQRYRYADVPGAEACGSGVVKLRFAATKVFFSVGPCIFVAAGQSLSLLHVMNAFGGGLGQFAVGDTALYTVEGLVIDQSDGHVVGRYTPPMPTENIDDLLKWADMNAVFQSGELEISLGSAGLMPDRVHVLGLSKLMQVSIPFPLYRP